MRNFLFLMVFAAFLAAGCIGRGVDKSGAVARVNDRTISIQSFETTLARLGQQPGMDFKSAEGRKDLLKEMIDEELLFQKALQEGLVQKSDRLRRDIAREYLVQSVGKERYEAGDEEIRKFFEGKKNDLEKVRASHILIPPEKSRDEASKILAMIRKEGAKADFAKYARKYSEDPGTKDLGGDLGFFPRGKMVKEFSDAAFALKKIGDVSDVVKTPYGYHIIKLTGEQRGFGFFRPSIQWQIAQEKQKEKADKLLTKLRTEARIEIYEEKK